MANIGDGMPTITLGAYDPKHPEWGTIAKIPSQVGVFVFRGGNDCAGIISQLTKDNFELFPTHPDAAAIKEATNNIRADVPPQQATLDI